MLAGARRLQGVGQGDAAAVRRGLPGQARAAADQWMNMPNFASRHQRMRLARALGDSLGFGKSGVVGSDLDGMG